MSHLVKQKLPGQLKVEWIFRRIQDPRPKQIYEIKHDWHCHWVTDPNQCNGEWQINTKHNSGAGGHDHLCWERNESHKKAYRKSARRRASIEAPEIWVIKQVSKYLECFLLPYHIVFREKALYHIFWHNLNFVSTRLKRCFGSP